MTAEFDTTDRIAQSVIRYGEEFFVVRQTNRSVVVRCPTLQAAKRLANQLRFDHDATYLSVRKGLRSSAWYLEAA